MKQALLKSPANKFAHGLFRTRRTQSDGNLKRIALFTLLSLLVIGANAATNTYWWVGGSSGNWDDPTRWSITGSGGTPQSAGAYCPGQATTVLVVFDNSAGNANPTVALSASNKTVNTITFTNSNVTFAGYAVTTQTTNSTGLTSGVATVTMSGPNSAIQTGNSPAQLVSVVSGTGTLPAGTAVSSYSNSTYLLTLNSKASTSSTGACTLQFTTYSAITTTNMNITNSNVTTVGPLTINSSLAFSGNSYLYNNAITNGQAITLGNSGAFSLTGCSASNYFDGNANAYFAIKTTTALKIYFNPNGNTILGSINPTLGNTTLGNTVSTNRLSFGTSAPASAQGLILDPNVTFNILGNGSSSLNSSSNCNGIDASASGSKLIITNNHSSLLIAANGSTIFKPGSTINYLEFNKSQYQFVLPQNIIVKDLVLTTGTFDNTTNGKTLTIINGGSITRSNQAAILTSPPIFGTKASDRVNVTIGATCNAANELAGTTGKVGTLTVNTGATYTLSSTFVTGYLSAAGSGYTSTPAVTIGAPNVTGGVQATASATWYSPTLYGIYITNPGTGYTSAPSISITGGGTGSGATATAVLATNQNLYADAVTVSGTLNFANTVNLPVTLNVGGNVTVNSGGAIKTDNLSNTVNHVLNVGGNISNSGTINLYNGASTKTVDLTLNGSLANQSLAAATLNSLTINNTASSNPGATLGAAVSVANTLNLIAGTLTNNNYLTLANGASVVNSGGTLANAPSFGTTINLTYNGAGVKGNEFPTSNSISSLSVNNTAGISLSDNRNIPTLAIGNGSSLTVGAGNQLTVSTSMTNNGTLNLLSDPNYGTATITTPATINGTNSANVSQILKGGRNWYLSSPVTGANATTVLGTSTATIQPASVVWYDESKGSTAPWTTETSTLSTAKGYVFTNPVSPAPQTTDGTITFNGVLNTGNIDVTLSRTSGQYKEGFNLIGNPYPSYLNVLPSLTGANVEQTIWYRTRSTGTTPAYFFETVNAASGVGTNNSGTGIVTGTIPPMQAFWVRTNADGVKITLSNSNRSHAGTVTVGATQVPTTALKTKAIDPASIALLRLKVSNGTNSDEAIMMFTPDASDGLDNYDSGKMTNNNAAIPEIYTTVGGTQLVINGMNSVQYNTEIPLGFTTQTAGNYSITAPQFDNFDSTSQLVLKDNLTQTEYDLTGGLSYNFSSDATTGTSRFGLIIRNTQLATGVEVNALSDIHIAALSEKIQISVPDSYRNAQLIVFNSLGQQVLNMPLLASTQQYNLYPGVYLVSVACNGSKKMVKVCIK